MGGADKVIRLVLAAVLVGLYFSGTIIGTVGIIGLVVAAVFALTSLVSICPLYPFWNLYLSKDSYEIDNA